MVYSQRQRLQILMLACGVLLVGWALMLHGLDAASMWFDEDYSWRISREGVLALTELTAQDVHPPVYYYTLWAWLTWTGTENLFVMRLNAAIPALLAVALTFRLGMLWLRRADMALLAALFLSSSGLYIFYARNLRMYALITLLLAWSWWALWRLLHGKRGGLAGYALTLALMAYTFYFAAFAVLGQFIAALMLAPRKIGRVLLAYVLALLSFAVWIPTFIAQMGTARAQSGDPDAPLIGKFLGTVPTSWEQVGRVFRLYSAEQVGLFVLLLALALWVGWQARHTRRAALLLLLWSALTVAVLLLLNLLIPVYSLRYTVPVLPAVALLVGMSAGALPNPRAKSLLAAVVLGVGVFSLPRGFPEVNVPHREMLSTVNERFREGDKVWYALIQGAFGSAIYGTPAEYHFIYDTPRLNPDGSDFVWAAPVEFDTLEEAARVWDVRPYWIDYPAGTQTPLVTGRTQTELHVFGDYFIRLYEAPPPTTDALQLGDVLRVRVSPASKPVYQAGETVQLKLWWQVTDTPPTLDYSRALALTHADSGALITQQDGSLTLRDDLEYPTPTSGWTAQFDPVFVAEPFELPADLPNGNYEVWMTVYYWQTPDTPLTVQGTGAARVRVAEFTVGDSADLR